MDRVKRIWYLSPMRAAKVQASLRIRAVSPEPSLLAHTSSESRGTFRQRKPDPWPFWMAGHAQLKFVMAECSKTQIRLTRHKWSTCTQTQNILKLLYHACKKYWAATWQNHQCGCAPSEDSDQPGHPPSLIRVFAVRMKKAWVLSYPLSVQRRLWSDWGMPRLIWVFAGRTLILLVLSWGGSITLPSKLVKI